MDVLRCLCGLSIWTSSDVMQAKGLKKKGVTLQQLKVDYYQSTKAWMTLAIFGVWLKTWNEKLARHCLVDMSGKSDLY